jgi:hypothetical protein
MTDSISRCELFNKLATIPAPPEANAFKAELYKVIQQMETVGRWIPCSERLPEEAGHYLCSFRKANRIDSIYVDLAYWTGGRWYGYLANEINAWMPLPEPWKGEDDDLPSLR